MSKAQIPEHATWFERHVIDKLDTLDDRACGLETDVKGLTDRLTRVEERATNRALLAGAVTGGVPSLSALIYWILNQ